MPALTITSKEGTNDSRVSFTSLCANTHFCVFSLRYSAFQRQRNCFWTIRFPLRHMSNNTNVVGPLYVHVHDGTNMHKDKTTADWMIFLHCHFVISCLLSTRHPMSVSFKGSGPLVHIISTLNVCVRVRASVCVIIKS